MRMKLGDINVYFKHDDLSPHQVRAAIYGRDRDSWVMIPEEGDLINDFHGFMGDPIKVRVIRVEQIGNGCEAYQVTVTDVMP